MKKLLLPILALCLLQACEHEVDDLPVERPFTPDFYVQGEWRDTSPALFIPFDYTIGRPVNATFDNQFKCRSIQEVNNAFKSIRSEVVGIAGDNALFFARFSIPASDSSWSESELQTLFAPGRTFPIAGNPGEAEIGFEIPWVAPLHLLSESGTLSNPSGEVKIITAEAYEWTSEFVTGIPVKHEGLKVKIQFRASLGRVKYVSGQLKVVGTAEIRNGEASLFFGY